MSLSSYDELLKQVECLKSENSHLRRELQDNSSHLTKLENEASNMKDVLSHIQLAMEDGDFEYQDGSFYCEENGLENLEPSSCGDIITDEHDMNEEVGGRWSECPKGRAGRKSQGTSPSQHRMSVDREIYALLEELDLERNALMQEIEAEDKHRQRFYEQLELLSKKLESLPLSETYNLQTDMTRRQVEYEAKRLQEAMSEKFGTSDHIAQRQQARLQRIRNIEVEMIALQQRHREQQLMMEKVDPSACNMREIEHNGTYVKHASTNTALCGEVFIPKPGTDNSGHTSDRGVVQTPAGNLLINIATQTSDVIIQENPDILQANLPHSLNLSSIYHGSWPIAKELQEQGDGSLPCARQQDLASVMSFNSTNTSSTNSSAVQSSSRRSSQQQQLGTKVEMVYSLLSMLGTHDKDDMSRTLLAMSSSQDSCIAMRQSGCMPLLIQLLHGSDKESGLLGNTRGSKAARARAAAALHNIVHSHPDDKRGRREARVLRLLEQIRAHCDQLRGDSSEEEEDSKNAKPGSGASRASDIDHHPGPAIAALMKLSFDEEHRHAICTLGGLQAIAELLQVDHEMNADTMEQYNITMRRYACMGLTNLTFGDGTNKALLCSMKGAMEGLVAQLKSPNEDLCQVAASVLRNLSWRADLASKKTLREVGAVTTLMEAAMTVKKESTLKSILSALWNLSAHCTENKADICAVCQALEFLVSTLTYKSPSKTLAIIENGGGILRNVSSHIAVREDYRKVLRQHGCLQLLLKHLRSPSLTIVSNACGTLWNLSARCQEDQQALWEMGAVSMLRNLVHSKHKMISMGSAAALKNLLSARPAMKNLDMDRHSAANRPGLHARKVRALEQELDQNLAETCENVESPRNSPTENSKKETIDNRRYVYTGDNCGIYQVAEPEPRRPLIRGHIYPRSGSGDSSPVADSKLRSPQRVARSGSQDSVGSTHSDISHDRSRVHNMLAKSSRLLHERQGGSLERKKESPLQRFNSDGSCAAVDRTRLGVTPNSRIIQVMQEVAMHAGLDPNQEKKDPQAGTPRNVRALVYQSAQLKGPFSPPRNLIEQFGKKGFGFGTNSSEMYQNTKKTNLNVMESNGDTDEPINYSLKYQDASVGTKQDTHQLNNRPPIKVGNFTGSSFLPRAMPNMVLNRFPAPHGLRNMQNMFDARHRNVGSHQSVSGQYGAYAETDLDSMDQPTNFSLRYAERTDDHYQDQPINYSVRYQESDPHCADCKLEEARRTNERLEEYMPSFIDDQVKTFCTEGTPYLSTATSLTDLTGKVQFKEDDNNKDADLSSADETQNFSSKYKEDEKNSAGSSETTDEQTGTTVIPNCSNDDEDATKECEPESQAEEEEEVKEQSFHSPTDTDAPLDQTKTYDEEGTPVCFSRVSSLSSLHSSEARDQNENQSRHQFVLSSIEETDKNETMTSSVIENTDSRPRKQPPVRESRSETQQGTMPAGSEVVEKEHKTVTFDDHHHVEETPLMFSRCSSLGSLSSFEAHSVHSSVVSEYSRRASEVVSPSELPDSPSETMPPSPKPEREEKEKEEGANDEGTEEEEVDDDTPQQFTDVATSGAQLIQPLKSLISIMKCETFSVTSKMEAPVVYADEGTPPAFSDTNSLLSALTIDDNESTNIKHSDLTKLEENSTDDKKASMTHSEDNSSMSEVSEGEEDILAQCISSAMPLPNNSNRKMRKSSSDNALKKKSGLSKIDNLGTAKSKLPTKMTNINADLKKSPPGSKTPGQHAGSQSSVKSNMTNPRGSQLGTKVTQGMPKSIQGSPRIAQVAPKFSQKIPKGGAQSTTKVLPSTPKDAQSMPRVQGIPRAVQSMPKVVQNVPKGVASSSTVVQSTPRAVQNVPQFNSAISQNYTLSPDFNADTVKTYATEGTPLNFSNATSLSDLSMLEMNDSPAAPKEVQNSSIPNQQLDDSKSDNSSLCEESEDLLLSQVIQAAMPKSKVVRRLDMDRQAEGAEDNCSSNVKTFGPQNVSVAFQPQRTSSQGNGLRPSMTADSVKTYAEEGTPLNFSNTTSLSDLTIESTDDIARQRFSELKDENKSSTTEHSSASHAATFGNTSDDSVFLGSASYDSPKVYLVEGTPVTFSRNDSLSSLSMVSEDMQTVAEKHQNMKRDAVCNRDAYDNVNLIPKSLERHVIGQSSEESSVMSDKSRTNKEWEERPKKYAMEGTPTCFSRNSSLSSLHSTEQDSAVRCSNNVDKSKDQHVPYQVEDTPAGFSRNSSLSELSVESAAFDPTPSEQALLDECISSAMPKSKAAKTEEKSWRHSHLAGDLYQRGCKGFKSQDREKNLLKSTSLEIKAEFNSEYIGENEERVPHKSQSKSGKSMSYSCSDASDVRQMDASLTRQSQYSSWQNQTQRLSEESNPAFGKYRFGWRRSHSQDSDSFLKEHKDSSNKEIAMSGQRSDGHSNRPFRGSLDSFQEGPQETEDNKMLEEARKEKEERRIKSLASSGITDSCSSIEKVDSEKSELDDSVIESDMGGSRHREPTSQSEERSVEDIMKVSFPRDLAFDTDDDILDVDEIERDEEDKDGDEADDTMASENVGSSETTAIDNTVIYNGHELDDEESPASRECSFDEEISPEDEKLLEENASLIVSELVTNQKMTGSACDDDMFIENETLSLVSNDYTSDTASEISISWSTNSEKLSEYSGSTLSQAEGSVSSVKGPKIVKPTKKILNLNQSRDDEKSVRGRRKPLYSSRSSTSSIKSVSSKSDISAKNVKPVNNFANRSPSSKNPILGAKKISPKMQSQAQSPVASSTPNKTAFKPKVAKSPGVQGRSNSVSGIPRTPLSRNTVNQSKLPSPKDTVTNKGKATSSERPKPLIKQGTFIKDSASSNAPSIDSNIDVNANKTCPESVKLRARNPSGTPPQSQRNSGGSPSQSQRNSGGSPPGSWSKALDGFNFIVDTSQENGFGAPYKQIQMQRNAKDAPPALRRAVNGAATTNGVGKKPSNIARPTNGLSTPPRSTNNSRNNLNKTGSGSNLRKTGSGSSLTKTSSGTCLTKTNSGSSLNKGGSNSNLKRLGSRGELKKSDSNASLKNNSRPTTPVGRKLSNATTPVKKMEGVSPSKNPTTPNGESKKPPPGIVGKRQVSSKIASLWKKEDVSNGQGDISPPRETGSRLPVAATKPSKLQKPSNLPAPTGRRSFPRPSPQKNSSGNGQSDNTAPEGLRKSSTYDKISADVDATNVPSTDEPAEQTEDCSVSFQLGPGVVTDISKEQESVRDAEEPSGVSEVTGSREARADSTSGIDDTGQSEMSCLEGMSSLNCSQDSLDEVSLQSQPFNSGTWKKKKGSNLQLPNADETCRSVPGSLSSISSVQTDDSSIVPKSGGIWRRYTEEADQNGDSDVWIKRDKKSKNDSKSKSKNSKKESKSVAQSIKQTFFGKKQGLSKIFGSQKQSNKERKNKEEPKPDATKSMLTNPKTQSGLRQESRTSPSAIVPPFNYSPPVSNQANKEERCNDAEKSDLDISKKSALPTPTKHSTKTEMLLARRRQSYLSNMKIDETGVDEEGKRPCMVTTV